MRRHALHVRLVLHLEAVAEMPHIRILRLHELVSMRHHAHWPRVDLGAACSLEAENEVTRMLRVNTEGVGGERHVNVKLIHMYAPRK